MRRMTLAFRLFCETYVPYVQKCVKAQRISDSLVPNTHSEQVVIDEELHRAVVGAEHVRMDD